MENALSLPGPSPWPRRLLIFGLLWGGFLIVFSSASDPTPENITVSISAGLSGLYTALLYRARARWVPPLTGHSLRNAMWLGSLNAAIIETIFLVVEKLTGAKGVAAHPNLILDLLITMPWYVGMVVIFVRVQHRRRFTLPTVLLLGALYEIGADGMVGNGLAALYPTTWVFLAALAYWIFIPVYSSMVLPPALLIATTPPAPAPAAPAWRDALRPLLWLIPFLAYIGVFLLVASVLSEV